MKKFLYLFPLISGLLSPQVIYGANERIDSYFLQEVKIIAPAKSESIERIGQEVKVIVPSQEMEQAVETYSGIEFRERGGFGVQNDLSIRGTDFEENLVLFEGIRISDPQTGHHLMNLPFAASQLSTIEILPGGASTFYGPGGFGGAINFNLKPSKPGAKIYGSYGSYDYTEIFTDVGVSTKFSPVNIMYHQKTSSGFIWNRDFDIRTFNIYTKDKKKTLFYGFEQKEFGARNFYIPKDTEWESTRTHLFLVKKLFYGLKWYFEPALLYRINYDTYLLDRNNPDFYKNEHKSQVFRVNLPLRYETAYMDYTAGIEFSYETLDSTRLGDHLRQEEGLYLWLYPKISSKIFPSFGIRYDIVSKNEDMLSYNFSLAYLVDKNLKLRSSAGFSYRLPSFTELYYDSPTLKGNPSLSPEKAYNLEIGTDYSKKFFTGSLTVFYRYGEDIIDWIKNDKITQAENLDIVKTIGFTIDGRLILNRVSPFFSYTYLNQWAQKLKNSRYQGSYLKHNFILGISAKLPHDFKLSSILNFRKRYQKKEVYLISFELDKKFNKNFTLGIWGKNLLDEDYEEIEGVKGIPQWFGINLKANF